MIYPNDRLSMWLVIVAVCVVLLLLGLIAMRWRGASSLRRLAAVSGMVVLGIAGWLSLASYQADGISCGSAPNSARLAAAPGDTYVEGSSRLQACRDAAGPRLMWGSILLAGGMASVGIGLRRA